MRRIIETDVVIIGAGTAGLNARRAVSAAGKRWVLVERGPYGTMCARVGCMPSKLLIAAGERAHDVASAGLFGVQVADGAVRIDGAAVLERVRRERDRFVGFVLEANERLPKAQNLLGVARFLGPTSIAVGDDVQVEAKAVVIATGSTPTVPPELADGEVNRAAAEAIGAEVDLRVGTVVSAERVAEGVRLVWREGETLSEGSFEAVLAATGRHANVAELDLARAGIACDAHGVPLHDAGTLQCGDTPVFVAGDVDSWATMLLHEAVDDGRLAGQNAASFPEVKAGVRRARLAITFCDPNIAIVGEAHREGLAVGALDFRRQGRARIAGKNEGLVHLYGRREDRRLVGGEMCGPRVEHLAHLVAWAVQARLTVEEALAMPFYHPVVEEGLRTALQDLQRALDAPYQQS